MAAGTGIDPIEQFNIKTYFPIHIGGVDASFTNSSLFMVVALVLITLLMVVFTSGRNLVPGRMQALAELSYEFVASTLRSAAGDDGMRFFPFIFSLFMFVMICNLMGLVPYTFSITSQIIVTFALAALVILTVIFYGIYKHGLHFLHLFVPSGVSMALVPFLVVIEVISFLSRPISLSVRLFANMLAGHITLKVFGGFVALLLGSGTIALSVLSLLPMAATTMLFAFELLVAVLQAYVFAILASVYLNDALHPGH